MGRTRAHRGCQALPHVGVRSAEPPPLHACTAILFCQLGRCTPLRGNRQGRSQQRMSPPVGLERWQCTCHSGCQLRCCSARCRSTRPLPCSSSEARVQCNVPHCTEPLRIEANVMRKCMEKRDFTLEYMCRQGCNPRSAMSQGRTATVCIDTHLRSVLTADSSPKCLSRSWQKSASLPRTNFPETSLLCAMHSCVSQDGQPDAQAGPDLVVDQFFFG